MRQLNRNAIFGPNIFGSTISYSIVNNDNTLDTRNDLWLQMCFLQRILLLIGKICSCLQKIAKYGKLGLMKNNWLTNLIKTLSKCKRNKVRSVCRKIKYGNVSIVPFFSQQSLSKHLVFTLSENNMMDALSDVYFLSWFFWDEIPTSVSSCSLVGRMRRLIVVVVLTKKGVFVINHPGCFCLGLLCCNAKTLLWMSLKTVIKFFVVRHVIAKGPYCFQSSSFLRSWW